MLKIGELAKQTGLNPSKIRFFEKEGIFNLGQREANGYRTYPIDAVDLLMLIVQAQEVGFTLKELKGIMPTANNINHFWSQDALKSAVVKKMAGLAKLQLKLADNQTKLQRILDELGDHTTGDNCLVNAKRILGIPSH